jgi:predicted P-loop ATPase
MKKPVVTHRLWANNTATNLMANKEQKQQPATGGPKPVATWRVALDSEDFESGEVLAWAGPDEADPAFVSWQQASGAVPTQVAIELAGTPAELVAWMVPFDEEEELDAETEAGVAALRTALAEEQAQGSNEDLEEAPPAGAEPALGYEGLEAEEQLKRYFDALGIEAHCPFVLSACYGSQDPKNPDKWYERWTHRKAVRMGASGDAELFDTLRYGKSEPTDEAKGRLSSWRLRKASNGSRNWKYFLRTAVFKLDEERQLRSFEQTNVERRREYFVEADGIPLDEQRRRVEQFEAEGLRFNAVVFSGGKSLQLSLKRPRSWDSTPEQDRWIDKALCVLFDGDTKAQLLNQAHRLPGFKRAGKHDQHLLWARKETYASYGELRAVLERLLSQSGVEDLEGAYAILVDSQGKKPQQRQIEARNGGEIADGWDAWDAGGGWREGERRVASMFGCTKLSAAQLIELMPRRTADLVKEGSASGCRNEDGLRVTLELRGVVNVLTDLGLSGLEEQAQVVLERFIEASGGDVDEGRLFDQYDGAEGAKPGKSVEAFMNSLWYETEGLLGKRKPKTLAPAGNTPLGQLLEAIGPGQWGNNDQGQPVRPRKIDVGEFAEMVENLGPALRWNDLTQQVEYSGEMLPPDEVELMYVDLNKQDRYVTQKTAIDVLVSRSRVHRYDPVQEYLEYLETATDVEPVDINSLATTYLGTEDPLYDQMLMVALLGAVARRFEPGCKFDYVVVLKGAQGIRKSTFWQALASPAWYTTSVPDDDKDLMLTVHSTWIFELAELESVTSKRSAGKLKNFISTSTDVFRVPYGKANERRPRRSIFVSTVNGNSFLRDESGERRYYVIECQQEPAQGGFIDEEAVVRDRDRIWKAVVLAYRAGQKPYLEHELQQESDTRNEAYQVEDPWGALLDEWLERDPAYREIDDHLYGGAWKTGAPEEFDMRQALLGCGVCDETKLDRTAEMRMAHLLRKRGYLNTQRHVGGRKRRLWRKAEGAT